MRHLRVSAHIPAAKLLASFIAGQAAVPGKLRSVFREATRGPEDGRLPGTGGASWRRGMEADGFAQVSPEHKYCIVAALQNRGHIVSMGRDARDGGHRADDARPVGGRISDGLPDAQARPPGFGGW